MSFPRRVREIIKDIEINKNTAVMGRRIVKFINYFKPVGSRDSPNEIHKVWSGTQAEYDAIESPDENTLYFIEEVV